MSRVTEPSPAALDYAGDDIEFALWLDAIDRTVNAHLFVSIWDLSDLAYRQMYDDQMAGVEVVKEIINNIEEF